MSSDKPRVSIGLPVYNGERFIRETVGALLAQTFEDFELVITDNASTDATQEICQAYAAQDPRVRYFRNQKNLGAARNYNLAFELCNGEYFKWSSHDDVCAPEFLERCVAELDHRPAVVLCYTQATVIDENGHQIGIDAIDLDLRSPEPRQRYKAYHRRFREHRNCNPVFGLMRADVLKQTPLIGNYVASDEVLIAELALRGQFYHIPEYLFMRREHDQMSVKAYNYRERAAWFDPTNEGKVTYPYWRWFFEQLSTIRRVPMSWRDKVSCYAQIIKWATWRRQKLEQELVVRVKYALDGLPGPIKHPSRLILRYSRRLVKMVLGVLYRGLSILTNRDKGTSEKGPHRPQHVQASGLILTTEPSAAKESNQHE